MLISSSDLRLGATHIEQRVTHEITQVRTSSSRGGEPTALTDAPLQISEAARALAAAASAAETDRAAVEEPEVAGIEPRMLLMAQIIARFFGRDVSIFVLSDPGSPEPEAGQIPGRIDGPETSLSLSRTTLQAEFESSRFEARGSVRTADGRQIDIDLELRLSRSFIELTQLDVNAMERRLEDPLVINLEAGSVALDDRRFLFDLDASGTMDSLPSLNTASGYLALDRNGNGSIDDGTELFGALSGNGFADLRRYDADGNGWIDRADPVFAKLQVWIGAGSEAETLKSLEQLGIGAIYLGAAATPFTLNGQRNELLGQLRSSGIFLYEDGRAGTVQQVDLAV